MTNKYSDGSIVSKKLGTRPEFLSHHEEPKAGSRGFNPDDLLKYYAGRFRQKRAQTGLLFIVANLQDTYARCDSDGRWFLKELE